jgi:hypothetical protein
MSLIHILAMFSLVTFELNMLVKWKLCSHWMWNWQRHYIKLWPMDDHRNYGREPSWGWLTKTRGYCKVPLHVNPNIILLLYKYWCWYFTSTMAEWDMWQRTNWSWRVLRAPYHLLSNHMLAFYTSKSCKHQSRD